VKFIESLEVSLLEIFFFVKNKISGYRQRVPPTRMYFVGGTLCL